MLMPRRNAIWRGMTRTLVPGAAPVRRSTARSRLPARATPGGPRGFRDRAPATLCSMSAAEPPPVGADAPEPPRRTLGARLRWVWTRVRLGRRLTLEGRAAAGPGVRIAIARGASVVLGDGVELGERARVEAIGGPVRIGAGTRLGERCTLAATAGIEIGEGCVVGDYVLFADAGPSLDDVETPVRLQPLRTAPIRVGDGARIGAHAAVLPGAQVDDGAVVGSYAVVAGTWPSACSSSALAE